MSIIFKAKNTTDINTKVERKTRSAVSFVYRTYTDYEINTITPSRKATINSIDGNQNTFDSILPSDDFEYRFNSVQLSKTLYKITSNVGEWLTGTLDFYYIPVGELNPSNYVLYDQWTHPLNNLNHHDIIYDNFNDVICDGIYMFINGSIEGGWMRLEEVQIWEKRLTPLNEL